MTWDDNETHHDREESWKQRRNMIWWYRCFEIGKNEFPDWHINIGKEYDERDRIDNNNNKKYNERYHIGERKEDGIYVEES